MNRNILTAKEYSKLVSYNYTAEKPKKWEIHENLIKGKRVRVRVRKLLHFSNPTPVAKCWKSLKEGSLKGVFFFFCIFNFATNAKIM